MASTLDSVRPLGMECPSEGGTQTRTSPGPINPNQDAVTAAGLHLQDASLTTQDKQVFIDRQGTGLRLTDAAATAVLSELVSSYSGKASSHESLRDLQHFLGNEGPGPGFTSGAYAVRSYSGPMLTGEIWYTSQSMTAKILSRCIAYSSGSPLPASCTWTLYSASGAVLRSLSDTFTYNGMLCVGILRSWS